MILCFKNAYRFPFVSVYYLTHEDTTLRTSPVIITTAPIIKLINIVLFLTLFHNISPIGRSDVNEHGGRRCSKVSIYLIQMSKCKLASNYAHKLQRSTV